jgi:hypothetical protein
MQLRETKLTPLIEGETLVEIVYSDHADEAQSTNYLRYRVVVDTRQKTTVPGIQYALMQSLGRWLREESNRAPSGAK